MLLYGVGILPRLLQYAAAADASGRDCKFIWYKGKSGNQVKAKSNFISDIRIHDDKKIQFSIIETNI